MVGVCPSGLAHLKEDVFGHGEIEPWSDVEIYSTDQRPVNSRIIDEATDDAVGTKRDAKLQKFLDSARKSKENSAHQ